MAKIAVKPGSTSVLVRIFVQNSSSTVGAGLAGLTNASGGLVASVSRDDDGNAAATVVTLGAGTRGTWSSGGFKEKDSTNQIGVYELGLTNASLAAGSRSCTYYLFGATNQAPVVLEIDLSNDANVVYYAGTVIGAPATAGIPDVNAKAINNVATTSVTTINANQGTTQPVNFTGSAGSALVKGDAIDWNSVAVTGMPMPTYTQPTGFLAEDFGELDTDIEAIQTGVAAIPTTPLLAANVPANFASLGITAGGHISNVDTLTTYTGNTPQTGDNFTRIGVAGAGLTSVALTSAYDFAKGTVAVTESYAANGVAPTPVQAIMAIHQYLMDFTIAGVNYTVKKLDNAATAFVVVLNDATSPTAASRT